MIPQGEFMMLDDKESPKRCVFPYTFGRRLGNLLGKITLTKRKEKLRPKCKTKYPSLTETIHPYKSKPATNYTEKLSLLKTLIQ